MRQMLKRLCAWVLAMIMLCTITASAVEMPNENQGIIPYYEIIKTFTTDLSIDRSGKAICDAYISTASSDYKITLTCTLYKSDGSVVKSWTMSGNRTVSLKKSWYVTSGSSYQIEASATVYNSSGNYIDGDTSYSEVVPY